MEFSIDELIEDCVNWELHEDEQAKYAEANGFSLLADSHHYKADKFAAIAEYLANYKIVLGDKV